MNEFENLLNTSYANLLKAEGKPCNFVINLPILKDGRIFGSEIIMDNRIENESKTILDTFNIMMQKVFCPAMSNASDYTLHYTKFIEKHDYSALVSYLSKVLEIEMNYSIIQLIRTLHGIEMPKFYNQVKPNVEHELNEKRNGKLKTFSIGTIIINIKEHLKKLPSTINKIYTDHRDVWDTLRDERNVASHTGLINEERFTNFYNDYCQLVSDGWFFELMNIKEQLRPNNDMLSYH